MLDGQLTSIRPIIEEDIDTLFQWYSDQEVNLWATGAWPLNTLLNKEQLAERFLTETTDIRSYAILAEDEQFIGVIGFREFNIPARSAALFIVLGAKTHWDRGYGSDAMITFLHFLFRQWNLHRISLETWDGNHRAIKTYEKAGFAIEGRQREAYFVLGRYHDAILMGLLQDEFFALHGKTRLYSGTQNHSEHK